MTINPRDQPYSSHGSSVKPDKPAMDMGKHLAYVIVISFFERKNYVEKSYYFI